MLSHEVINLWVGFDLSGGLHGLSPGEMVSLRQETSFSSLPWISSVFGQVASLLVADKALAVSDMLHFFTGREIDLVHVHGIGIWVRGSVSWRNITVSSSSEFPELYYVLVGLSCLVKPLLPLPAGPFLPIREGSSGHHDSELLGNPSLEGVHEDAVIVNSTAHLGQFKGSGVFIEVSIELVHAEGVDDLAGSVFDILQDEGLFKSFAYLFEGLFQISNDQVG